MMRPMMRRGPASAIVRGCGLAALLALPAAAQEPLFLRIRPQGAAPAEIGAGGAARPLSEADLARQARAAREAVWERANARARIVIASVCTGCLKPLPPEPAAPPADSPAAPERAALRPE